MRNLLYLYSAVLNTNTEEEHIKTQEKLADEKYESVLISVVNQTGQHCANDNDVGCRE